MRNINGIFKKDTSLIIDCPFFLLQVYRKHSFRLSINRGDQTGTCNLCQFYVNASSQKRIKSMFIIIGYFNVLY